jgi:hypothetical protein
MKSALFLGFFLIGASALACNQQEAQIIAKIYDVIKTPSSCTALVRSEEIRFFASSFVCPLDQAEVTSFGVSVGLTQDNECALNKGGELNGVLLRIDGAEIILE